MEGLGVAASVIAVIELSAKVASVCAQYSHKVKHAAEDIDRLQSEVKSLQDLLQNVKNSLGGPNGARLSASLTLSTEIDGCTSELTTLDQSEPQQASEGYEPSGGLGVEMAVRKQGSV